MPSQTRPAEVSPTSSGRRPWRADLRRSLHLFTEFRYEQPDPARFYTALAQDSAAHVAQYADLDAALLLDVGGGPGYFRDAFRAAGATYLRPRLRRRRARRSRRHRGGHRHRQRHAAPVRGRLRGRLLLLQRPRARARAVADGRGDGAGHPSRRPRVHQLHHLVRPLGRPRDLAVALPGRSSGPPTLRGEARSRAQEPVRRVALRRHRRRRPALGAAPSRTPRSSTSSRATTPGGAAGCSACRWCERW